MFWVEDNVICYVCGEVTEHTESLSASVTGCCDLDSRPPEMLRSLLHHQIQRCPFCGYCSTDISKGHDLTVDFVKSEGYQARLNNKDVPQSTATFYNFAEDKALQGEYADAAWNTIHAAWACDDASTYGSNDIGGGFAPWFRGKALIFASKGEKKSQYLSKYLFVHYAILIDLMRRGGLMEQEGNFGLALNCARMLKEKFSKKPLVQLVDFQISLIMKKDSECHNLSEIPDWSGSYSIPNGTHLCSEI